MNETYSNKTAAEFVLLMNLVQPHAFFMIRLASSRDYLSILKFTEKVVVMCRSTAPLNEFSIGYCVKISLKDPTETVCAQKLSDVTPHFLSPFCR